MTKSNKPFALSLDNITTLARSGFNATDILTIGVCLTLTDNCWCSTVTNSEIISRLGLSERNFYYVLGNLKKLGVEKRFGRYDYSKFVEFLTKMTSSLDNP